MKSTKNAGSHRARASSFLFVFFFCILPFLKFYSVINIEINENKISPLPPPGPLRQKNKAKQTKWNEKNDVKITRK